MQNFDIPLPQEEQPAEMVDRREEQQAETVDRREEHPAEMADRREEHPAEMADRREEHPEEMADRREGHPAEMADRRGRNEPKPVDIPETTPHFFKIILSPHASKLHIPNEFVTEYGTSLGDVVLLEVPNGVVWKVKLQKDTNDMVWLKEGWNKFKEYYSIGIGYFLLFTYKGNSQFSVFIFDLSSCEIKYPPGPNDDTTRENQSVVHEPPEGKGINLPPPDEPPEENAINIPLSDDPSEENAINLPPPDEPPEQTAKHLLPPDEPLEENVINLPPQGIYTMEELSRIAMPSWPKV
ncbi:unnamed protein product [Withania somnifera]